MGKKKETPGIGHNSAGLPAIPEPDAGIIVKADLLSVIERVEHLEEEKKGIAEDIKEVYAEAKARGYDTKVLRKLISERKRDAAEREEQNAILNLYATAIGMDLFA